MHCRLTAGLQMPPQVAGMGPLGGRHAKGHCWVSVHVPLASQVRSVEPLQLVVPGAQIPWHPAVGPPSVFPSLQMKVQGGRLVSHAPAAVHF